MLVAGVGAGQAAQRHQPRHETEIGGRFAGRDKLVHLVGLGEVVERLGRGVADRLHRAVQIGDDFTDRNQPRRVDAACFILPCSSDKDPKETESLGASKRTESPSANLTSPGTSDD